MSYDKNERVDILKSMHRLMCAMNDEEAYMAWIICIPDGADETELEDIALHDEEIFSDACNLFNRLVKGYACKSGYTVSNRSGTNCKVYGVLGGKINADRKM
ncbi:MAG: hypothetical protein IJV04_07370 [Lachnospiraceae bacterium]|nr:hypothetical protein [Clostridia bacterium]MBQ8964839.1 hypothetical protein [Clostridia bacterium]MBQ9632711.1 hypothetical protein [Lachnospiraceae bacterium]